MTPRQCRREISARAAVPRRLHTREAAPRRRVGATAVVGARGAIFVTGDADMEMQDIDVAQRMVEVHAALAAAVGLDAIMGGDRRRSDTGPPPIFFEIVDIDDDGYAAAGTRGAGAPRLYPSLADRTRPRGA